MRLSYLATILVHPRDTMRRILDRGKRWSWEVVMLAYVCASVGEASARNLSRALPGVTLLPGLAMVALGLIGGAIGWLLLWWIIAWIALPIGRLLGGTATISDIRAALAWGLVPVVWSPLYRIPGVILAWRFDVAPTTNVRPIILNFLAHGGCSLILIYLLLQVVFEIACVVVGSFTLAEAQRFSTEKGFINVVSALVLPVLVIFAAIFSFRS
ncbi:MAG TPA: Yip1 family protein [Thermoanaerobaculia bacterium]|nr:Yip1 family protein [Thermoanaerobaculia bacterium]